MSTKRVIVLLGLLICVSSVIPSVIWAQSSTTGTVGGTVTDPTGAIVPGATVTLAPVGTNVTQTTTTDSSGRYLFPAVNPGRYNVKCSAKGFRSIEINQVDVEILKAATVDIHLAVGQQSETVEVVASSGAELQTSDASIGTVMGGDPLLRLPAQQRSITAILMMQPATSPSAGSDDVNGGMVSGALADQSTFFVDGGDATSDLEGTNNYVSPPGEPQPAP